MKQNTHLLWDERGDCIFVDAGCNSPEEREEIEWYVVNQKLNPVALLLTHGHFDHILGASFLCERFGIESWLHKDDEIELLMAQKAASIYNVSMQNLFLKSHNVIDGTNRLTFGDIEAEVIHTPGHSKGSVCYLIRRENILFAGDTIIRGSIGFSNDGYGELIEILKERIVVLPPETRIYSGHGECTTLMEELNSNPFFKMMVRKLA